MSSLTRSHTPCIPQRRRGVLTLIAQFSGLWRQRRTLRDLDSHLLRDIGITPDQARREASRPFWDAPDHWQK